ncbi:ABC transporter substrate-binding protein [Microlunatus soli]|uniref:Peptide/nickel transport system substrate-binding protein n=1 Tax=Microlunatus soli TaxID=630515 RepID=A0A1H1PJI5_9ACTN|nr:ABC transporter substrate-binding protein [Microlunatus soli]SDS11451.1 peptide/nickel transport system substrate-binding protein [Microlunatus soli]
MITKRIGGVIGTAVAALLVVGCGGNGAAPGDEPTTKSDFSFALASDPSCINPRVAGNNDGAYPARQLVDSLTDQDPETGRIVGWLATKYAVNSAATRFTFTLRDGVTFSDGTAFDATSVKQNFDEIVRNGAEQPQSLQFLAGYQRTVVVSDRVARVEFSEPNAQFLQATASHFLGMLAPSSLKTPPADRCAGHLVGTGPYTLDHYTKNTEVVENRRNDYRWGSSLWDNKGAALSAKLIFKVIPESGVRTGALKSGQVDAIGGVPPQDEAGLKSSGFTLQSRPNPGQVFSLVANEKSAIGRDTAVRQALSKAIDRQAVVKAVLSPSYHPATSTLARTTPGWTDLSSELTVDQAAGRKLLDRAGWKVGPDGIRTKAGKRLQLKSYWSTNFNPNQAALELIQQQAKAVGIELDLNSTPIGELQAKLKTGDFDLSWGNSTRPDPDILRNVYWQNGNAAYGITDPKLIKSLTAQQETIDQRRRSGYAAQAQKIIVQQAYGIPVFELTTVLGLGQHATGIRFDSYSRLQFHDAKATEG